MHKVIGFVVGLSLIVPAVALANSTVTTSVDTGSTISPSSAVISTGGSQVFNISANTGWHLSTVAFDGIAQGTPSIFTVSEDGVDHTLNATSASNGGGGLIYGSSPLAPGWVASAWYVQYNGTSCPFSQGCILPH